MSPGAVALYIDKFGISADLPWNDSGERQDCPATYIKRNALDQRVMDALRVIGELRISASWWNGELLILGGSEGAVVAENVALLSAETSALIIFGFGGRWFEGDVVHSIRASMSAEGAPKEAQDQQVQSVRAALASARTDRDAAKQMWGYSHAWWASMLEFDQQEALRRLHVPVFAAQGLNDENVSVEAARKMMEEVLVNKADLTFKGYDGLDHGFRDIERRSQLGRVIDDMARWLRRVRSSHSGK